MTVSSAQFQLGTYYQIVDMTDGLSYPDAYGLNNEDQICGDETSDGLSSDAFVERTLGNVTPANPPQAVSAGLLAINDYGTAVGGFRTANIDDPTGHEHAYTFDDSNRFQDLSEMLGFPDSWASDINNEGAIVGTVRRTRDWSDPFSRAFLLEPGATVQIIDGPREFPNTYASAINNLGQVVGTCYDDAQMRFRPFRYTSGGPIDEFTGQDGFAMDINDAGHIACTKMDFWSSGESSGPFLWANGNITWLP